MLAIAFLLAAASPAPASSLVDEMQRVESARNAAIKAGDLPSLEKIYAADFSGIAANGTRVDRKALFAVFKRNAGGDFIADSRILSARKLGSGLVAVEGRLRLTNSAGATLSDSHYLHLFQRKSGKWKMVEGAAVPISRPTP